MLDKFDFVQNLPSLVIVKDIKSLYLRISHGFAKLLGWRSAEECQGATDYLIPSKASEFANEFIKMDKKVVDEGVSMLALDIQTYSSGKGMVLAERNPVKDQFGKVVGLYNQCIDVSQCALFRAYSILNRLDNKLMGKPSKPASYILSNLYSPLLLTERQEDCLFLLIRGKTLKEIGKALRISHRTVESHLEAIKNKLNCQYKSEVIDKAIDKGFLYYVPKNLQKYEFDKFFQ